MKYRIDTNIHNPAQPISIIVDHGDKDWRKKAFITLVEKYEQQDVDVRDAINPILTMCEDGNICTGHIAFAPSGWNMAYTITRLLGEEGWNNLLYAISDEPEPTDELKELMGSPRRYVRHDPKVVTIEITGQARSGKTSVAAILYRLLESAGVSTTLQSDDLSVVSETPDIMAAVARLKATGSKVVIKDLPSTGDALKMVYTVPELIQMLRELEGGSSLLIRVAENGTLYREEYEYTPVETFNALLDLSLIGYAGNPHHGSVELTSLGQVVFDQYTAFIADEEDEEV